MLMPLISLKQEDVRKPEILTEMLILNEEISISSKQLEEL